LDVVGEKKFEKVDNSVDSGGSKSNDRIRTKGAKGKKEEHKANYREKRGEYS